MIKSLVAKPYSPTIGPTLLSLAFESSGLFFKSYANPRVTAILNSAIYGVGGTLGEGYLLVGRVCKGNVAQFWGG
eukprot:3181640-Amphidinium_carterae.1